MAVAAFVVAAISAAIALASAWFARGQLRQARVANSLATAFVLFREFRGMTDTRFRLGQRIAHDQDEQPPTFRELGDDVVELSHLLDNIGMLVAEDLVPAELVAGYMGNSVIDLWEKLGPSIEAERKRRRERGESDAYQVYFEHLAVVMREVDPDRVRAKLKRWTWTPERSAQTPIP